MVGLAAVALPATSAVGASNAGRRRDGVGISGVAPGVTTVAGKVLSNTGSGLFLWTDQALIYAWLKKLDIVSASLGGYVPKCGNNKVDANVEPLCDHPAG